MNDVKRYGFDRVEPGQKDGWAIRDKPDGHLVSVTDYDSRVADIARLTERVRELEAVLRGSIVALDDWLHDYAAEMCDAAKVTESRQRIFELGTIGYIATVQAANRAALEKREGG